MRSRLPVVIALAMLVVCSGCVVVWSPREIIVSDPSIVTAVSKQPAASTEATEPVAP